MKTSTKSQTVCLTFDDCALSDGLEWTLDLLREHGARGTFFIATGHVTVPEMRQDLDVERLLGLWRRVARDGHEVACHTRQHLDGSKMGVSEWVLEISDGLEDLYALGLCDPQSDTDSTKLVTGFRAPKLETNPAMFEALKELDFEYDSSLVLGLTESLLQPPAVRELPMRLLRVPGTETRVPPLDFNMWLSHQMNGERFYQALCAGFLEHGNGARAAEPLVFGFHPDEYDARYEKADRMRATLAERRRALSSVVTSLKLSGARFRTCVEVAQEMEEKKT